MDTEKTNAKIARGNRGMLCQKNVKSPTDGEDDTQGMSNTKQIQGRM